MEQASNEGQAQAVELDIQTVGYHSSGVTPGSSQRGTRGTVHPGWKTMFKMVIHLPNDNSKTRVAKLDTGASVDVLSQSVADALGMTLEPYTGGDVTPLGEPITPIGQLTLDWHVMAFGVTYTTTFLVLDRDSTKAFDVLLSDDTIGKIGFYRVDTTVWYLRKAWEET